MDRLDGLLGSMSGSKIGEPNSGEPGREPRVNFNEQPNRRRTYGSTRGRGSSSSYATGDNKARTQTSEKVRLALDRPQMNDRRKTHMRLGDVIPGTGVMRIKEEVIPAIRTGGKIQSLYQGALMLKRSI